MADAEKRLQNGILQRFGAKKWLRLWRQNTGVAKYGSRKVAFGLKGCGDLTGIVQGVGRRIEIECKAPNGRQSQDQKNFQRMIEAMGGIYVIARTVSDVDEALREYNGEAFCRVHEPADLRQCSVDELFAILRGLPHAMRELRDDPAGMEMMIVKLSQVVEELRSRA